MNAALPTYLMPDTHAFESYICCRRTLHTAFYKDVKNSAALHKALLDQAFDVALINASLVRSRYAVLL